MHQSACASANLQGSPGSLFYLAEPVTRLPNPALGHVHTLSCPPLGVIILIVPQNAPPVCRIEDSGAGEPDMSWSCLGEDTGPEGEENSALGTSDCVSHPKGTWKPL